MGGMALPMAVTDISLGQSEQLAPTRYRPRPLLGPGPARDARLRQHRQASKTTKTPALAGDIDVGGTVVQIDAGHTHTCARLDTGGIRCWGGGAWGKLGYANSSDIGDDETPVFRPGMSTSERRSFQIAAGGTHSCALLSTGNIRCWGEGGFRQARLRQHPQHRCDDETPAGRLATVDVGGTVLVQVVAGYTHAPAPCSRQARCAVARDASFGPARLRQHQPNRRRRNASIGRQRQHRGDRPSSFAAGETATPAPCSSPARSAVGVRLGTARLWQHQQHRRRRNTRLRRRRRRRRSRPLQIATGIHSILCAPLLEGGEVRCWGNGERTAISAMGTSSPSRMTRHPPRWGAWRSAEP